MKWNIVSNVLKPVVNVKKLAKVSQAWEYKSPKSLANKGNWRTDNIIYLVSVAFVVYFSKETVFSIAFL